MLHKTAKKRCSSFVHYFLFYAIVVAYLPLTGCFGGRTELIPDLIKILPTLREESQEQYMELMLILQNDKEKKKLEKEIQQFNSSDEAEKFIEKKYQTYTTYSDVLTLLPKSERTALEEKWAKTNDLNDQAKFIDQYSSLLKIMEQATTPTQQHYIDLLELLPEDQAIALKHKIVQSADPNEVEHLIVSEFDKLLKDVDNDVKKNLSNLEDLARQEVLKTILNQNGEEKKQPNEVKPNHKPVVGDTSKPSTPNRPNDGHSTTSASKVDAKKLIKQKQKEQEEQKKQKEKEKDGWGPKLPLEGEERKQFLTLIMQFSQEDQNYLKELFNKADSDSIENFFSVFFTGFNKDEGIELLRTMVCLYRANPNLTLKLCNDPQSLSRWDRTHIFYTLGWGYRITLLTKLDRLLS